MSFTAIGADITLLRNPGTGKFDFQWDTSQNPVYGDDLSHIVLSLIYERKGEYFADLSGSRGSYLWSLKDLRKSTPSKIKGYIEDALQPLVDQRRIIKPPVPFDFVTATKNAFNINRVDVTLNYSLPSGQTVTLRPSLGY